MKVNLKGARANAGYTLDKASELFEIARNTLWNYENYKTTPKREFVEKIPKIYNCKIDDIIFFPNKCGLTSKSEKDT